MIQYIDRKNTDCFKWDGLQAMFGEEDLLPLWVADMDFQAPEAVRQALARYVEQGVFGYYKIPKDYRESFIAWEKKRHGYAIKAPWIRWSPGVVAAFNWVLRMVTDPGDAALVLTPVYYPFLHAVKDNDRKLVASELVNTDGTYSIDFDDFEKKIVDNDVKAFILCSPHNPVGRVWTREELQKMFRICKKYNVFVIADEIHHDLVYGDHKHIPALAAGEPGEFDDMMMLLTAPSKTFNLAACQNSIIVIPDAAVRRKWDDFTKPLRVTSGTSFGYIAARAAYEDGEAWLEEVLEIIDGNYQAMRDAFAAAAPEVRVTPLEGTYLAWIDLGAYMGRDEIEDFMQKKCGLAFDYGFWFGGDNSGAFVRMNLATSRENVMEATKRMIDKLPLSNQ